MNYETITLTAFLAISISCLGCLAADWLSRRWSREVIPYSQANAYKPGCFQANPRYEPPAAGESPIDLESKSELDELLDTFV